MTHKRTSTLYSPGTAGNLGVYVVVALLALLHVLDLTSTPALVRVFRSPGGVGAWALLTTVAASFGLVSALLAQTRKTHGWVVSEGYAAVSSGLLFGLYALGVVLDREATEPLLSKQLVVAVGLTAILLARAAQIAASDLPTLRDKRPSPADPPAPGSPHRQG